MIFLNLKHLLPNRSVYCLSYIKARGLVLWAFFWFFRFASFKDGGGLQGAGPAFCAFQTSQAIISVGFFVGLAAVSA